MTSVEERFKAAVNVIKGLPKNGPYQPSNSMLLKFYGCYKQATEGECTQRKPAFWDVVGKAKWDAWKANSHLTKEQAMQKYVEDLREIIETMSFTEKVADFVGSIGGLDSINLDELELVAPGMREIAESHPNSPFNSRTNSPQHGASSNAMNETTSPNDENQNLTSFSNTTTTCNSTRNNSAKMNGHHWDPSFNNNNTAVNADDANDNDVNIQSATTGAVISNTENNLSLAKTGTNYSISTATVDQSDEEYGDPVDIQNDISESLNHNNELLKQIQATVVRMNSDLMVLNKRMSSLERNVHDVRSFVRQKNAPTGRMGITRSQQRWPEWWPFRDISPAWFALLVLWPFLLNRIALLLRLRRRKY